MDSNKKKRKNDDDSDGDGSAIVNGEHWPRYWIMEGADVNNPLPNPFVTSKGIQSISSTIEVRKLKNGSLLLRCEHRKQAIALEKTVQLVSVPVKVTPHRTLNSSMGIIRCRDIYDMTEEEIQLELASQGIAKVKRFTIKKDGQVKKTNTYLLTFQMTTPPQSINVGYLRVKVEAFVPNPLRCYKCQRYGHGQNTCKGQSVCHKCSKEDHGDDPCTGPLKCVNCAGSHSSSSKQCPIWIKERAIQKLKVENKLSYPEAKKQVEALQHTVPIGGTYASVTIKRVSISTQTNESCFPQSASTMTDQSRTDSPNNQMKTNESNKLPSSDQNIRNRPAVPKPALSKKPGAPQVPGRQVPRPTTPPKPGGYKHVGGRHPLNRSQGNRSQKGYDMLCLDLPSSEDDMDIGLASISRSPPRGARMKTLQHSK